MILPPGPVPLIALRSTPNSVANFFAIGLAFTFILLDEETGSGLFSTLTESLALGSLVALCVEEVSGTSSPSSPIYAIKSPTGTAWPS